MTWPIVALLVAGGAVLVWLVWTRRTAGEGPEVAERVFVAGITLAGVGAATITTLGPMMVAVLAVGVVLMAIAIQRGRPAS